MPSWWTATCRRRAPRSPQSTRPTRSRLPAQSSGKLSLALLVRLQPDPGDPSPVYEESEGLPLRERVLVDEDAARLRPLVAADDPASLEHVHEAAGSRVADAEAPLEERDRGRLRLDDDLDRAVEERVVVRVEFAVCPVVLRLREDL